MRDLITDALKAAAGADYAEIRLQRGESSNLSFLGQRVDQVGRTTGLGGNVRALARGGWGFVSFNDLKDLRANVELAVRQARLAGAETSQLAPIAPVVAVAPARLRKDPRQVPLAEKKRLLDEYNELIWRASDKIQTSILRYADGAATVYFANTEGSYIEQEHLDMSLLVGAIARDGNDVQQAYLSAGESDDYGAMEQRHAEVEDAARRAVNLLSAKPVKGGMYTVVIDPYLTGVFIHEAFGHLSEADHVYENERLRELMQLGRRFGPAELNVFDGAAEPGLRGSYAYDAEGAPAQKTYLIREGVLVGRLHSRETAGKMGELPTGNARALNSSHPPLVRMTNTAIEAGSVPFDQMISDIKLGIYAKDAHGGETSMEMFTFAAAQSFMIRDGKLAEEVRGVNLTGNLFETLTNIEAIGNDFCWARPGGGCGKGGQSPLPVDHGGPHVRIRNVVVGGE
jgi:TldD protein